MSLSGKWAFSLILIVIRGAQWTGWIHSRVPKIHIQSCFAMSEYICQLYRSCVNIVVSLPRILQFTDDYVYSSRPLFLTSFLPSMPFLENSTHAKIYGGTFTNTGTSVHGARSGMKEITVRSLSKTSALQVSIYCMEVVSLLLLTTLR